MGKRINTLLILIIAVISVAAGIVASVLYGYWQGQNAYDRIAEVAHPEELPDASVGGGSGVVGSDAGLLGEMSVDWDALLAINADTVGWIYVPGTPINYPVVHSRDNDEYLYINFNGEYGNGIQPTYGTPFLMKQNAGDFSDPASFIQAHDMENGTMFAEIPKLGIDNSFNEHRSAYLLTPTCNYRLQSIALVVCGADDPIVRWDFYSWVDFWGYVEGLMSLSIVAPDPEPPEVEDIGKLIVLSTCTADGTDRRELLVCAVVEYAEPGGESHGALGDAAVDREAAAAMDSAMDEW